VSGQNFVVNVLGVNQQRNSPHVEFLCPPCTEHHKHSKKFQSHSVIPMTEMEYLPKYPTYMCREYDKLKQ